MQFTETLRVALESIRGNLFRATLTMLGVIIGVGAVITMMALGTGAQRAVEAQLQALGANVLTVTTQMRFLQGVAREQMTLTTEDSAALAAGARHVTAVVPEQQRRQQVKFGNRNLNLQIVGTTPDHPRVNGLRLGRGRLLTLADDADRERVAVLGGEVPGMLGSTPEAMLGARLTLKNVPFEVVGVYERRGAIGFSNPDDQIYVPLATSQYRLTGEDRLQSIAVQVAAGTVASQAMVEIERVLRRKHGIAPGRDNDFAIVDRKQFLATQQQTTEILSFLLAAIAGVSLLVGGIGIMNIMLVTVTERTREIGLRKAIGATRGHILLQFLIESMTLCVLGGVLGILLGIGGSALLARLAGWQTYVSGASVLLAFGFSAAVGLLFGLWPASRAARLDPIEALRHE
jgi:putative ABC transport system permease protein